MARAAGSGRSAATNDSPAARRLREAAIAEFAERGYGASSTRDIAARIGLSAAAMYPHYSSKEELLYAISVDGHRGALEAVRAADSTTEPPLRRLRAVVAAFAQWHAEHTALARVVQYEIRSLTPVHYRHVRRLRQDTTAVLREILLAGQAADAFDPEPVEGTVLAISSLCVDICRWFPSTKYKRPSQVAALYADVAVRIVQRGHDDDVAVDLR